MANWSYEQNFDSLDTGDLNGQDSWSGSTDFKVQTDVVAQGTKAAGNTANLATNVIRVLPASVDGGKVAFRIRTNSNTTAEFHGSVSIINEAQTAYGRIRFDGANLVVDDYVNNNVATLVSSFSVDTWYLVEVEFDGRTFRARVNEGSWTNWFNISASAETLADRIRLNGAYPSSQAFYVDDILPGEPPPTGPNLLSLLGVG